MKRKNKIISKLIFSNQVIYRSEWRPASIWKERMYKNSKTNGEKPSEAQSHENKYAIAYVVLKFKSFLQAKTQMLFKSAFFFHPIFVISVLSYFFLEFWKKKIRTSQRKLKRSKTHIKKINSRLVFVLLSPSIRLWTFDHSLVGHCYRCIEINNQNWIARMDATNEKDRFWPVPKQSRKMQLASIPFNFISLLFLCFFFIFRLDVAFRLTV